MMIDNEQKQSKRIQELISSGSDIAGGAIGGALGFYAAGPLGAAAFGAGGVIAAHTLKRIGAEISDRVLAQREQVRIGGVMAVITAEIQAKLKSGGTIRGDGFFNADSTSRSDAEEVAESILQKSQREPEERKLKYIGRLFAGFAFRPDISAPYAHQIVKACEALTYRQLCILAISQNRFLHKLQRTNYRNSKAFPRELYELLYEIHDLYQRGLVNNGSTVAFSIVDIVPKNVMPQGMGIDIIQLMRLDDIPQSDLQPILHELIE